MPQVIQGIMVVGMKVIGTTSQGIERCSYEQPELKFG